MSLSASDAISADPRLAALEGGSAPAFAANAAGTIVWANAAGRALAGGAAFDPAAARTLGRMAAAGAGGLVRVRIGAAAGYGPLTLGARPFALGDGQAALLLTSGAPSAPFPHDLEPADGRTPTTVAETRDEAVEAAAAGGERHPSGDLAESPTVPATDADDTSALRFVFETDPAGRLAFLSPDLAAAVGPSARDAVGRAWAEVADDLDLDPSGAVARALQGRGGWNGLIVRWPTADGRRLPVELSALPMFDRGRTFVGFRGFGAAIVQLKPAAGPGTFAEQDRSDAAAAPSTAPDAAAREAAEPPSIGRTDEPTSPPAGASPAVALSTSEEDAFDEIARRLTDGAAFHEAVSTRAIWEDIAADAELSLAPPAAVDAPLAGERPEQPQFEEPPKDLWETEGDAEDVDAEGVDAADLQRLLDQLPVGAMVLQAGALVFANRAALELTGHGDLGGLAARGADALFASLAAPHDAAAGSPLRATADAAPDPEIEGAASDIVWRGAPATLVTLTPPGADAAAARTAAAREAELAAILDTATDGVLTLDGGGRILALNRSAEALFGYEAREIVGSLFSLALAPESRRAAFDYLDGLKQNGVAALLNDGREVLGLVRQGGAIPLYLTLGRIGPGDDGRFCAVLRDITHWKKAEEELLAAKRQAERANAQKSDFLAKVSHEIRTPLNAIIGFAEVMIEERFGALGNERYREYLKDIHLSGGHLVSLVNDLLDLSRIEAGNLELEFARVDLNETVAQAVALLQPQANRERIIIRTSLARGLPQVLADRRSIRQIVLNLAANAVKFTQGGGQVIVATGLTDLGQAVIRVRDTGVGMSRKELALALEPFRQLSTTGPQGAGVGLPLTKALVEANEAVFTIQSAPGDGTLVEVTFPSGRVLAG